VLSGDWTQEEYNCVDARDTKEQSGKEVLTIENVELALILPQASPNGGDRAL
jgi:hypothetical protein